MKRPLAICAVSGGRADYGLLTCPLRAVRSDPAFTLDLVLTGQHLDRSAGYTAARGRAYGFEIAAEVDICLGVTDHPSAVTPAARRSLASIPDLLATLSPHLVHRL